MPMKKWEAPKLIVLVRGNPEESLLAACKTESAAGGDPNGGFTSCSQDTDDCPSCSQLQQS
jgi:hypothetical protein